MDRLAFLARRLNVDVRHERPLVNHACLTRRPTSWLLSVSRWCEPERRAPVTACLLKVIDLGWDGHQFPLRFPTPGDTREVRDMKNWERRHYRIPYRLGIRLLVTDAMIAEYVQEDRDPRAAAEDAGVPVEDLVWRVEEWQAGQEAVRRAAVTLGDLVDQGLLRPASAIAPSKSRPKRPPPPNRHAVARMRAMKDYDGPITF